MSVAIPFIKASACGNDFLLIEAKYASGDLASIARRICDRHNGIGADGVEWLLETNDADIGARLINADGSEAEISGNGTRCVAAYLCSEQPREKIVIRTGAGLKTCTLIARREMNFEFETGMGEPEIGDETSIRTDFGEVRGIPVSMGNPHYVVFVRDFPSDWQAQAAQIGKHRNFAHGVNVELVRMASREEIEIRIFERGAGETQSSGTGSCAAAVAAIATHQGQSPMRVQAPGGSQRVRWDASVYLRGCAQILCRGEFYL